MPILIIASIDDRDVIDYVRSCLPYIPKNRNKKKCYEGKSLRECVEMVKGDAKEYEPISDQTCKNRFVGFKSVFEYALNRRIISLNPASKVEIVGIRVPDKKAKELTEYELSSLWGWLSNTIKPDLGHPERYWVTVLALYHGCRQNEICSLRLKDVYKHADGTVVFDINSDGAGKSVKTKSSIRIVPVHPYVLEGLDFQGYLEARCKEVSANDLLFPNLTYTTTQGYGRKISQWFNTWKSQWLDADSGHKNFHSLRHTFIKQAQNQAKMPDRYNQEITGHAVQGVSSVHMIYSGTYEPKDVLLELSKLRYGWEGD